MTKGIDVLHKQHSTSTILQTTRLELSAGELGNQISNENWKFTLTQVKNTIQNDQLLVKQC